MRIADNIVMTIVNGLWIFVEDLKDRNTCTEYDWEELQWRVVWTRGGLVLISYAPFRALPDRLRDRRSYSIRTKPESVVSSTSWLGWADAGQAHGRCHWERLGAPS